MILRFDSHIRTAPTDQVYYKIFNESEVEKIIATYSKSVFDAIATSTERFQRYVIPMDDQSQWIYTKLGQSFIRANLDVFRFNLTGISEAIELWKFEDSDYKSTKQLFDPSSTGYVRKLTCFANLSDLSAGVGGRLYYFKGSSRPFGSFDKGAISIIPSYNFVEIQPIITGPVYFLVGHSTGPNFV